jgi:hypothetical protein
VLALGCAVVLAACGGTQRPAADVPPAPQDTRTPIEQRRDAACERLGPKLTACAVEDAKADLAAGKTSQQQFEQDTAAPVQAKNTEEFERQCKGSQMSSRQVRVLEVCFREETQCDPLRACLENLKPRPAGENP